MKKNEFEKELIVGIAWHRLALLKEITNRNLYYSNAMHEPEDIRKIYLLELCEGYFILRSDLIFDDAVQRFFYITKERYDYSEKSLKDALFILRQVERRVYNIFSKSKIRGFYSKSDFVRRLLQLIPKLELVGDTVRARSSGTVFITVKKDLLYLVYKDGATSSYMNIVEKDLNEKILAQCVEIIKASLRYEGI